MVVRRSQYEELLASYSNQSGLLALLKQFRPYLEMIPSMRRPDESLITIPLPIIRLRTAAPSLGPHSPDIDAGGVVRLPCDIAVVMCDPEWKIKVGVEIFIFIHRPNEDFSDLLGRWRQTQIWLDKGYEWLMPSKYEHIFSEGTDKTFALFVAFPETPHRIKRGLDGAALPYVIQEVPVPDAENADPPSLENADALEKTEMQSWEDS
jgi:hypothetical protein